MPDMRIEVVLPNESAAMSPDTLIELARRADELGFTAAWLPDHLLPPESFGATFGGVYDPLVTIGYLAAVTERIQFGTSVLIAPLRNPFAVAKQAATAHALSGGRFILGVGVGWNEEEFRSVGGEYRQRGAITDDMLALWRHLFSGVGGPYSARRFSYEHGVFAPIPASAVPIMVGGNSEAALRRARKYADIWQGIPTSPQDFARKVRMLADHSPHRPVTAAVRFGWPEQASASDVAEICETYSDAGAERIAVHPGRLETAEQRLMDLARALRLD